MWSKAKRKTKDALRQVVAAGIEAGQQFGVDILPRSFYSEIPDIRALRGTTEWRKARSMHGIAGSAIEGQNAFVRDVCSDELTKYIVDNDVYEAACDSNERGYGPVEADFLHCYICARRPKRVVQIGAGVATRVMVNAAAAADYAPEIVCIDPFPTDYLKRAAGEGSISLHPIPAQEEPLETFLALEAGDLLFVDSTHAVRAGSEVNMLILEVLPRLKRGVQVHFHDIYFPYDYGRSILNGAVYFYNETVLLQAYLTDNPRYRIQASMSMLHYESPGLLGELLPRYKPSRNDHGLKVDRFDPGHFPSSTYLEVAADPQGVD